MIDRVTFKLKVLTDHHIAHNGVKSRKRPVIPNADKYINLI